MTRPPTGPLVDAVAAVRSMPGDASREGLHVLARDLIEREWSVEESTADTSAADTSAADTSAADTSAADTSFEAVPANNPSGDEAHPDEEPPVSGSLLGRVVDVFVGARRLANWSLWLQLAAVAHLIARWQSSPPILPEAFPAPSDPASPQGLAERLWRLVNDLEIWGSLDPHDLAEAFVASEIAAASGLSHYTAGQVVDAARALFMTTRLPRTRALLRAGLLDWTKLGTILSATQELDDEVCALVEAAVIADADLAVAEPLDVLADPTRPGAPLPSVARVNNPTLRAQLFAATAAIDAEAAARRSAKARADRAVSGTPLPDGMGKLEVRTGQEQIAAILTGLDAAAAAAKAAGDPRRMDQIRCDHAVHLLTDGAFGADAYPPTPEHDHDDDASADAPDEPADESADKRGDGTGGGTGRRKPGASGRQSRRRRRGLQVRLTVPLSTWLDLADDPAVLDGYGAIPSAIARQIAADALRDHPETTTWRCVVVGDRHRTVLGVGDLIPTPRHDPTDRQATFTRSAEPFCTFPGCRVQAWCCDIDHRIPYNADNPSAGGPTCTCNTQPLCRRHHRLRTAGLITPRLTRAKLPDDAATPHAESADRDAVTDSWTGCPSALADADTPPGTITWTTFTGRSYEHRPPAATPEPAPREVVAAAATIDARRRNEDAGTPMDEIYDENTALGQWDRSRQLRAERAERATQRRRPTQTWQPSTPEEPPF